MRLSGYVESMGKFETYKNQLQNVCDSWTQMG